MSLDTLPSELFPEIIEIIEHDEDVGNLALSCREFTWVCQKRLFRRITLLPVARDPRTSQPNPAVGKQNCPLLHRVLLESPHLTSYIRDLTIVEGLSPDHPGPNWYMFNEDDPSSCCWIGTDMTLPVVLDSLDRLEVLDIKTEHSDEGLLWHDLRAHLQACILRTLAKPSLTEVSLSFQMGRIIPSTVFDTPLKMLRLYSDHTTVLTKSIVKASFGRPILRSLFLVDVMAHGALDWLLTDSSPVDITQLETFSAIPNDHHDHLNTMKVLEVNALTITKLSLALTFDGIHDMHDILQEPIHLAELRNLRQLRFRVTARLTPTVVPSRHHSLLYLTHLIGGVSIFTELEDLTIYLPISVTFLWDSFDSFKLSNLGWESLDEKLTTERCPKLHAVTLFLGLFRNTMRSIKPLAQYAPDIREKMVIADSRGILKISSHDDIFHAFRSGCD